MTDSSETNIEFSSLRSITRGASLFIVGKIIYNIVTFLVNYILTHGLGTSLYGVYAYTKTVVSASKVFTNLGSDKSILKYIPEYEDDHKEQNSTLGIAFVTSLAGAGFVGVLLFYFAPTISRYTLEDSLLVDSIRVFVLVLLFDTLVKMVASSFRGLELMEYHVLIDKIIRPVARLLAGGLALYVGFSFVGVMAALAVASMVVFIASGVLLLRYTHLTPTLDISKQDAKEYYNFSVPLTVKDAGSFLYNRVDILMVGIFLSSSSVGIYNIAVILATLLALPLSAFSQLFPPVASRLYTNDQMDELNSVFTIVTRWTFTLSLLLAIGAFVYRVEALSIFGSEFAGGATVLALFIGGQLLNNAVGPSGYVLMMTEHQYLASINQTTFGVLNVILNYIFITSFGIIGAALATASVLGSLNIVRILELWYLEGLFPYSIGFIKPLLAGVGAGATMVFAGQYLSNIPLLIVGGGAGSVVYFVMLFVLGIEDEDKEFFDRVISSS